MILLAIVVLGALATAVALRDSPATTGRVSITAVTAAVVAGAIAVLTGNLLLMYLESAAWAFGLVLRVAWLARRRGRPRSRRG